MTPRDVIERLTLDERAEIAAICCETLDIDALYNILLLNLRDDEMMELGLRIKHGLPAVE